MRQHFDIPAVAKIRELLVKDESFRGMCEDLAAAEQALGPVDQLPVPVREERGAEGPVTEIEQALCRSADTQSTHFAINRGAAEAELFRGFSRRRSSADELHRSLNLLGVQGLTARPFALFPCGGDTVPCSLGDQPALEMRDGAEDMEDQLAGGRGRVDPLLKAKKVDLSLPQHLDRFQ